MEQDRAVQGQGAPDFEGLYDEFAPKIRRYLGRLAGREGADDLSQEVFAKIAQALPGFRGQSKPSTWVYRIATNVAVDALRRRASDRAGQERVDAAHAASEATPAIDDDLARREVGACIRQHVERLPDSYRVAVSLSEEGLTNREIADALDVSLETVKIRLHRARRRLRRELGAACTFYRDERNELGCAPIVSLGPLAPRRGVAPSDVTPSSGGA